MGLFDNWRQSGAAVGARTEFLKPSPLAESVAAAMEPFKRSEAQPRPRVSNNMGRLARMMYASGEPGRLTGDWPTNPVHIDWIIQRFQRALVARSREQATNNDFMKAYIRLQRINIIGPHGIQFHSLAMKGGNRPDKRARLAVAAAWEKWGKVGNCDVTGTLSWLGVQKQACDTVVRDGEAFMQIVPGDDVSPMGIALRMIDPQRCPIEYTMDGVSGGSNYIRHGIEFNQYGRPVAYHFTDEITDRANVGYQYNGRSYTRIPASEIIHLFVPEFPSQKRGLPWMATGLFRAKQTQAMEDAAVVNARVGAAKMGFIQFKDGTGPEYDGDDNELAIDAEAGTFPVLPSGAEFKEFAPQYPQGEFATFVKHLLHGFAAGGGVSYHSLTGDLEDVNFSSIRAGTLDEREAHKEKQEWMREHLHERVFAVVFPRLLLASLVVDDNGVALPASKVVALSAGRWQPRRWQWIDPAKEVNAAESWKNNLLTSPSQLIREQGRDPDQVFQEIGQDCRAMKAAGIPDGVIASAFGQKLQPTTPPLDDGEGTAASKNPDEGDNSK